MDLPLNIDFSGKVVVVTGAGGVLCGTMAKAFAQAGAKVAALDLNEEAVKALADECKAEGFICEGYKANVLEPEALEAVHQQVLKDLGPCDILVNGAGGNNPRATTDNEYQHEWSEGQKGFFDLDAGGVDFVFKLNFQGTLLPTQAFAKDMVEKKSGCILNISSMNAYIPLTYINIITSGENADIGKEHEQRNILQPKFRHTFIADGTTTEFFLNENALDEISEVKVYGQAKTQGTDYTVDLAQGSIKFNTAPAKPE